LIQVAAHSLDESRPRKHSSPQSRRQQFRS
jgi:hypothetical protein